MPALRAPYLMRPLFRPSAMTSFGRVSASKGPPVRVPYQRFVVDREEVVEIVHRVSFQRFLAPLLRFSALRCLQLRDERRLARGELGAAVADAGGADRVRHQGLGGRRGDDPCGRGAQGTTRQRRVRRVLRQLWSSSSLLRTLRAVALHRSATKAYGCSLEHVFHRCRACVENKCRKQICGASVSDILGGCPKPKTAAPGARRGSICRKKLPCGPGQPLCSPPC